MEIVPFGFWFRKHLVVAKASKPPPAQTWCSSALFHCKHPSLVTRGPKLYKVWKTKLIILPGVHHWNNSAASTTWDKCVLTSSVTSNQLCNSDKRTPDIPHFAVSFYLSSNCSLGIKTCVHVRGVSAAGKGRKERQRMRWWYQSQAGKDSEQPGLVVGVLAHGWELDGNGL